MTAEKSEASQERHRIKGTKVWILEKGQPRPVVVTLGISDGNYTEISTGDLREGQNVITDNLNNKKGSSTQRPPPRFM